MTDKPNLDNIPDEMICSCGQNPHTPDCVFYQGQTTAERELRVEILVQAKKRMVWDEQRATGPTLLEYLRAYKWGEIGEIHIKAVIETLLASSSRDAENRGRTAVLSALNEWADKTEAIYNDFLEAELSKVGKTP